LSRCVVRESMLWLDRTIICTTCYKVIVA